ncbi:hypothetical protein B0T25DRAFT_446048 [Lasiosphaeria hispida]|uniref:Uncharacterized protein n=1 Tax=Lasiosphaeria hispida TaxID=260671 RepID=A0AAJ0HUB7_9PEZI|nr:hypothetical protein B0T25DRAFT_446048 [Lasiosphaeria hispida]
MGGSAFGSGPNAPYTPRMAPAVYRQVRGLCHAALRELFVFVATPIEGPEKRDHGDLDVLVAVEKRVAFPSTPDDVIPRPPHLLIEAIKKALHADHAIITNTSANLAIPWPEHLSHHDQTDGKAYGPDLHGTEEGKESSRARHIQVDVRICSGLDQLCWGLFKHAHGDIWNLLGSTIRPLGLTVDEDALWIRIPEIEKFDRKRAKVQLTNDPVEVIHFLGLAVEGYWSEPFASVEELFGYVTTCRLFWVQKESGEHGNGNGPSVGVGGREEGREKLKSNDRRRMKGRPIYERWINKLIPQLQAEGRFVCPGTALHDLRATVRDEAFDRFLVEGEYRERLRLWRVQKSEEGMKGLIKEQVPADLDPPFRGCLVSAMKKVVLENDQSFGISPPAQLKDSDGVYNKTAVQDFIMQNWQQLGDLAWANQLEKARQNMRIKELKEKSRSADGPRAAAGTRYYIEGI